MNERLFATYVLTQISTSLNLITQVGGEWKILSDIGGLGNQTYKTRELACAAIVEHYFTRFNENPGLARDLESVTKFRQAS